MPHLLGFPKTHVLDLLIMLFYPAKVLSIGFEFLSDSCSVQCAVFLSFTIIYQSFGSNNFLSTIALNTLTVTYYFQGLLRVVWYLKHALFNLVLLKLFRITDVKMKEVGNSFLNFSLTFLQYKLHSNIIRDQSASYQLRKKKLIRGHMANQHYDASPASIPPTFTVAKSCSTETTEAKNCI